MGGQLVGYQENGVAVVFDRRGQIWAWRQGHWLEGDCFLPKSPTRVTHPPSELSTRKATVIRIRIAIVAQRAA